MRNNTQVTLLRIARTAISALTIATLAVLGVSCKQQPVPQPQPGETVTTHASFTSLSTAAVAFDMNGPVVTTKASTATVAQEQRVTDLWIVQYDASDVRVGTPIYIEVPIADQTGATIADQTMPLTVATGSQTLRFLANTHNATLLTDTNTGTTTLLDAVVQTVSTQFNPETADAGLPMYGTKTITTGIAKDINLGQIHLQRLVAKITIKYKVLWTGFTVTGVQLRNVAGSLTYKAAQTGSVDYPAAATNSHFNSPLENLTSASTDGDYKTFTWYVPENLRAAITPDPTLAMGDRILTATDGKATYIKISGLFDNGSRQESVRYSILLGNPADATNGTSDFNLRRNTDYTAIVDIKGANVADHRLSASTTIEIPATATANSYLVLPGTGVSFLAKIRSNEAVETLAVQSVAMLWQDVSGLIESLAYDSDAGRAIVIADSDKGSGNALVAAYDGPNGTGNILWSWHIWVTNYKPSDAGVAERTVNTAYTVRGGEVHTYGTAFQTLNGTNRTIMDRTLGARRTYTDTSPIVAAEAAEAFGMCYQWGRKDPFPFIHGDAPSTTMPLYDIAGALLATPITVSSITPTSQITALQNPATLYCRSGATDWVSPSSNALWGTGTVKSLYDPCPKGWRVPNSGTWDDFNRSAASTGTFLWWTNGLQDESTGNITSGRRYTAGTVNTWYPASGARAGNNGQPNSVGSGGYSVTSTPHISSNITTFNFFRTTIGGNGQGGRTAAFSLRCIQE